MNELVYPYQNPYNLDNTYLRNVHLEEGIQEKSTARWIKKGEHVIINGLEIKNGLFYLGTSLMALNGKTQDQSLINPNLKVHFSKAHVSNYTYRYSPCDYSELEPIIRGKYLQWLASEKDDLNISLPFLELYFFGIERRILVDSRLNLVSNEDFIDIFDELGRMASYFDRKKTISIKVSFAHGINGHDAT